MGGIRGALIPQAALGRPKIVCRQTEKNSIFFWYFRQIVSLCPLASPENYDPQEKSMQTPMIERKWYIKNCHNVGIFSPQTIDIH